MCQSNNTTENLKGKHLSYEERRIIEHLYNTQKKKATRIAEEMGKHRTTIEREIKRGLVKNLTTNYEEIKVYSADVAQEDYSNKGTAKGAKVKIGKDYKLEEYIEQGIKKNRSPEVLANEIKGNNEIETKIHWKTIYNYIDKEILNVTREDLQYGKYKKRKKSKKKEDPVRKMNKAGRRIYDRPEEVESRETIGHWEMDTVEGKKEKGAPILLVLSERASRKEIIIKMKDKTEKSVIKALDMLERKLGVVKFRETFKTITTDNGSEFRDWEGIEKSYTGSKVPRTRQYLAEAYCAWQRGTNENINKMIRIFLPKGTSFKGLTNDKVQEIEDFINTYPRKMFGFKSANQVYEDMAA
jgi:IS30 family transposase